MAISKMWNCQSFLQDKLEELIAYNFHLPISLGAAHQYPHPISMMAVVAVAEPEIRKHLFLLRLYSNLGVTKDHKEIVVGDRPFVSLD